MKIGVALSGCDIGGVTAWCVLRELKAQGFDIGMVSACCIPAVTSLPYARGCEEAVMRRLSEAFVKDAHETDVDFAVANLSAGFRDGMGEKIPLAINAVNVPDGGIVTFTDDYSLGCENLKTFAIEDPYDALSAAISLMDGLGSYRYEGRRLCDFSCWYGCAVQPLTLKGLQKIISVAFLPKYPKSPYEALVKRMIGLTASYADIHIPIEFNGRGMSFEQYEKTAVNRIKSRTNQIFFETLF